MDCENPSPPLDEHQMYILEILTSISLLATIGGCSLSISNCIKIKIDDPFPKLVLYTAIADLFYSILLFCMIYNTENTLCIIQQVLLYFFINCSLSSNAVISSINYIRTRSQQNIFKMKYKKWLFGIYSFVFINDIVYHIVSKNLSHYVGLVYFEALSSILTLYICISNLRVIYLLKKENLTLENKAPLFLSLMAACVYCQATATDFMKDSDSIPYVTMLILAYFLGTLIGFLNYIISNKRIKELMVLSNKVSENGSSNITYSVFKELNTVYNELNTVPNELNEKLMQKAFVNTK